MEVTNYSKWIAFLALLQPGVCETDLSVCMIVSLMSVASNVFLIFIIIALLVIIFVLTNNQTVNRPALEPLKTEPQEVTRRKTTDTVADDGDVYGVVGDISKNSSKRNTPLVDDCYLYMGGSGGDSRK